MRFLTLFILSIILVVKPLVPIVEYVVNYTYISEVLCENKSTPQKKCNGKCHLKKELNNTFDEKKNSPNSGKTQSVEEIVNLFIHNIKVPVLSHTATEKNKHLGRYVFFYKSFFINNIFHPPAVMFI